MTYLFAKWLHIIFSTLIFGTGIGSAFYLLVSSVRRDPQVVSGVARIVVTADWLFTATTAVLQPLTGLWLVHVAGYPLETAWIVWSMVLYAIAIACWLPVVWLQIRMRNLATQAARTGDALPAAYWRCFRLWVMLGVPAFIAFMAIFYLMVAKPAEVF